MGGYLASPQELAEIALGPRRRRKPIAPDYFRDNLLAPREGLMPAGPDYAPMSKPPGQGYQASGEELAQLALGGDLLSPGAGQPPLRRRPAEPGVDPEHQRLDEQLEGARARVGEGYTEPKISKARLIGGLITSAFPNLQGVADYLLNEPGRRARRPYELAKESLGALKETHEDYLKELGEQRAQELHGRTMQTPIPEAPGQQFTREQREEAAEREERKLLALEAGLTPDMPEYKQYVYGVPGTRDTSLSEIGWADRQAREEGLRPGSPDYANRVSRLRKSLQWERQAPAADRRAGEARQVEETASDALERAGGDANGAIALVDKAGIDPALKAKIRQRIREKVRPGVSGKRNRASEILEPFGGGEQ